MADTYTGHILVVDDNPTNRDLLVRRLSRMGHTSTMAENGVEALEKIEQEEFDAILLDIMMPKMNGYEVLEHLNKTGYLKEVPVIMITAVDSIDSVVSCVKLGATDYLTKPFNRDILNARLGHCLERRHLRKQEQRHLEQIEEERKRADELLHVILPDIVAEELKSTNEVKPRRYDDVAVIFTDLVGFTSWCDQHTPEEVVDILQRVTVAFEEKAIELGIQKIKTIGDAFMATAGLLTTFENPVLRAVEYGHELVRIVKETSPWSIRVGIHVGPVIAGIVGQRQYLFDLYGDTVNTAARVESNSDHDAVCLSLEAWDQVSPYVRGESLGTRAAKGKGEIEIFRVDEITDNSPNANAPVNVPQEVEASIASREFQAEAVRAVGEGPVGGIAVADKPAEAPQAAAPAESAPVPEPTPAAPEAPPKPWESAGSHSPASAASAPPSAPESAPRKPWESGATSTQDTPAAETPAAPASQASEEPARKPWEPGGMTGDENRPRRRARRAWESDDDES